MVEKNIRTLQRGGWGPLLLDLAGHRGDVGLYAEEDFELRRNIT